VHRLLIPSATLLVVIGVTLTLVLANDSGNDLVGIEPTSTLQPEAAAGEVVQRFIDALVKRDADGLYAIQEDAYKQACDRESFQLVADRLNPQPLEGPASIVVKGDKAAAALFEVQPDGSKQRAVILLVKQADGSWRLAAPSSSGCVP